LRIISLKLSSIRYFHPEQPDTWLYIS